ncbi:MAG: elongation factor P [Nitriliruptorales bacterium]|nr:elongation factor P [Nitriliruptorales bacterium]
MVSTNNLKSGMTLKLDDGKLWQVVDFQHVKPGKGGAFVRTKLKNVETGKVVENTFRAGIDVEQAMVMKKTLQFLYKEGDDYVLMDTDTYDQRITRPEVLGEATDYLVEGSSVEVLEHEGRIVGAEMPAAVTLEVTHTEPGVAGNTATNATKPATLETGVEVQVPLFVDVGDEIKVDTRTGEYLSRA